MFQSHFFLTLRVFRGLHVRVFGAFKASLSILRTFRDVRLELRQFWDQTIILLMLIIYSIERSDFVLLLIGNDLLLELKV